MLLTYENCKIRNATPKDAHTLCRWWNDGNIMAHAGFPNGLNKNAETVAQELSTDSDDTYRRLIIEIDDKPVGEMNYRNKGGAVAEIGIKICESDKQEQGYGTRFLKMLIQGLFDVGYEKIILDTNLENTRAQHVYEKLGFRKLRVNYDSWRNQLGELQSQVEYELLKEDCGSLALIGQARNRVVSK